MVFSHYMVVVEESSTTLWEYEVIFEDEFGLYRISKWEDFLSFAVSLNKSIRMHRRSMFKGAVVASILN